MPLSRCRVLVVEDEYFIGERIADVIGNAGGQVVGPFATMIEALESLSDLNAIDGAVLDVNLGEDASFILADALQTTRIPFLFLTGMAKDELPERFAATAHMMKPFTDATLVEAMVGCGIIRP